MSTGSERRFAQELHRTGEALEEVPSAQVEALQKLYEATNGAGWDWDLAEHESRWDWDLAEHASKSAQLSKWKGITIDENGNVVGLCLPDVRMDGQLPNELGQLQCLRELRLNNNRLWGPIPESLAKLTELRYMDLSVNDLTGRLPDLSRLTRLLTLDVSYNRLEHEIGPLGRLTELSVLDLANNMFDGRIPQLGVLTQLKYLDLSNNRLSGHIPEISTLKNLQKLDLSNNSLTGTISPNLGGLGQLKELDLSNNRLFGTVPRSLAQLLSLKRVTLRGNRLDDDSILPELVDRQLMKERVVLTALFEATGGEDWYKKDRWRTEAWIGDWIGITTNSSGFVESIELRSNNLSGPLPPELGKLTYLKRLDLRDNHLDGPIPSEIGHLWRLEVLDLGKNSLEGCIPENLFYLELLRKLYLDENGLEGPLNQELRRLYNIEEMDLGNNTLKCEIPPELSYLKTLKSLRLSDNELTGEIPPRLFDVELSCLDLSKNYLSGQIPDLSVESSQRKLEYLDLSENRLSGRIPNGLVSCSWSDKHGPSSYSEHGGMYVTVSYDRHDVIYDPWQYQQMLEKLDSLVAGKIRYELFDRNSDAKESDEAEEGEADEMEVALDTDVVELPVWKPRWRFEPQFINLSNNAFDGMVPEDLMAPSIEHLNLGGNGGLRVSMVSHIDKLHHIKYLNLDGVQVVDQTDDAQNLPNLTYLDLSNNGLEIVPAWVLGLSHLKYLILNNNRLASVEPWLSRFEGLVHLDISNNELEDFPSALQTFRRLARLDLSNNRLKGEIPTELFKLKIGYLDLHNNSLEDSENWRHFVSIDPYQEVGMTYNSHFFRYLDLTGNRLEAPVLGGHLSIFGMLLKALNDVELEDIGPRDGGSHMLAKLAEIDVSDELLQELDRPISRIVEEYSAAMKPEPESDDDEWDDDDEWLRETVDDQSEESSEPEPRAPARSAGFRLWPR